MEKRAAPPGGAGPPGKRRARGRRQVVPPLVELCVRRLAAECAPGEAASLAASLPAPAAEALLDAVPAAALLVAGSPADGRRWEARLVSDVEPALAGAAWVRAEEEEAPRARDHYLAAMVRACLAAAGSDARAVAERIGVPRAGAEGAVAVRGGFRGGLAGVLAAAQEAAGGLRAPLLLSRVGDAARLAAAAPRPAGLDVWRAVASPLAASELLRRHASGALRVRELTLMPPAACAEGVLTRGVYRLEGTEATEEHRELLQRRSFDGIVLNDVDDCSELLRLACRCETLRSVEVHHCGAAGPNVVLRSHLPRTVERVCVCHASRGPTQLFSRAPPRLTHLDLRSTPLGPEVALAVVELVGGGCCPDLRVLGLGDTGLDARAVRQLAADAGMPRLARLELDGNPGIGPVPASVLALQCSRHYRVVRVAYAPPPPDDGSAAHPLRVLAGRADVMLVSCGDGRAEVPDAVALTSWAEVQHYMDGRK